MLHAGMHDAHLTPSSRTTPFTMKTHYLRVVLLMIAISFGLLFSIHHHAFKSHMRHGVVQDGQVSQFAGEFLGEGSIAQKYQNLMAADGVGNGRYRPVYYVFETIPFILTILKNGHYFHAGNTGDLSSRVNGDLRFHMTYLMITISLSLSILGYSCWKMTGSLFYSSLIPVSVIVSPSMVRNITYTDTAEVPQLLGFAVYFICFCYGLVSLRNNKFPLKTFLLSFPALLWIYGAKETSVALTGFSLSACLISSLPYLRQKGFFRSSRFGFYSGHCLTNLILSGWVVWNVFQFKNTGNYAKNFQPRTLGDLGASLQEYGLIIWRTPLASTFAVLGLLVMMIVLFKMLREKHPLRKWTADLAALALGTIVFAGILLVGNLNWEFILPRYMLPVVACGSVAGSLSFGLLDQWLKASGKSLKRLILMAILLCWTTANGVPEVKNVAKSYEYYFGANVMLDPIVEQLVSSPELQRKKTSICLEVGKQSWNLWFQVARVLNQEHRFNIILPEGMEPVERVYFESYPNANEVVIYPADSPGYSAGAYDLVLASVPDDHEEKAFKLQAIQQQLESYEKIQELYSPPGMKAGYSIWVLRTKRSEVSP
jgi:hypothetical protein